MVFCNLCRWSGPAFNLEDITPRCPSCGSSDGNRSVFHVMGKEWMRPPRYDGLPLLAMNVGERLGKWLIANYNTAAHDLRNFDTCKDKRFPYSDRLFYSVVQGRELNHVYYDCKIVKEAFRVLAVGGRYFSSVSVAGVHEVLKKRTKDGRWRVYSEQSYRQMLIDAGFKVTVNDLTASADLGSHVFVGLKEL
jgi:hypothetical protein